MEKITDFWKSAIGGIASKRTVLGFIVLLIVLFVVLVLIMFFDSATKWVGYFLGIYHKIEIIKFIGKVMSGVLAVIGLVILIRRYGYQLIGKKYTQECFITAVKHLEHDDVSVRIAAFHDLAQLANDNQEEYRKSISDILYAYMRTTTDNFANRKDVKEAKGKNEPIHLSKEIQELLDILFKSHDTLFSGIQSNLQGFCFSGANLADGDFSFADFSNAKLVGVNFDAAHFFKANLSEADLNRASLQKAELTDARFFKANLFRANLSGANLEFADFSLANLSKIDAWTSNMSIADFTMADLSHADLREAILSGANLYGTDLSGADLSGADLSETDLSEADLSNALLCGAFYTNKTEFPFWFELPIVPPDNGDVVQFPKKFIAPEKPKCDK